MFKIIRGTDSGKVGMCFVFDCNGADTGVFGFNDKPGFLKILVLGIVHF